MSLKHPPWMPLHISDYLADTMHLTAEQHGCYLLLLMHHWRIGPLPNDEAYLAKAVGLNRRRFRKISPYLQAFFEWTPTGLVDARQGLMSARQHYFDVAEARNLKRTERQAIYAEYLQSDHWGETRDRLIASAGHRCQRCGASEHLQVHHLTYVNLGNESDEDLQVLCRRCHAVEHGKPNQGANT